jgi:hypothetical protein
VTVVPAVSKIAVRERVARISLVANATILAVVRELVVRESRRLPPLNQVREDWQPPLPMIYCLPQAELRTALVGD